MASEKMDRVCALLTGMFLQMKDKMNEGKAFIAGMNESGKLDLTVVVIGSTVTNNRQQMGILVNALRQQDEKTKFVACGMLLDVTFTDQATGKQTEAAYVCLEDREGNAEDVVFPYHKKLFGGFKLDSSEAKPVEARVFGPRGDELVGLVKDKLRTTSLPVQQ